VKKSRHGPVDPALGIASEQESRKPRGGAKRPASGSIDAAA
jgi:hypothetical protein